LILPNSISSARRRSHPIPTNPFTDWINFSESYPTPSLKTISTFSMSLMVAAGFTLTVIKSACLPGAIEPILAKELCAVEAGNLDRLDGSKTRFDQEFDFARVA
jgi:hypothetical protein